MGSKSIWKGSISFGLVNIPINCIQQLIIMMDILLTNWIKKDIKFNIKNDVQLNRDMPYSEIKKGYEISKDKYVLIEKEDLEKIKVKTTKTIDIKEFIDTKEFDPILIEKSYYVAPYNGKDSQRNNKSKKNK